MSSRIEDYEDIIELEHHKSENYPWMTDEDRAAQFAPFAALTGFDEVIRETTRRHEQKVGAKGGSEFD